MHPNKRTCKYARSRRRKLKKTIFLIFNFLFTMRTLDLNAYGVYEMNDVEMRDAAGGGWLGALLLIMAI